jgi:hypothetical protein
MCISELQLQLAEPQFCANNARENLRFWKSQPQTEPIVARKLPMLRELTAEERERQRRFSLAFRKWWERAFRKAEERKRQEAKRAAA